MIISTIGAGSNKVINGTSQQFSFTIAADQWAEEIRIDNVNITADANGDINFGQDADYEARMAAYDALLYIKGQGEGYIIIGVDGTIPSVDIPIVLTIFPQKFTEDTPSDASAQIAAHNSDPEAHKDIRALIGSPSGGGVNIQSDWDVNDETDPRYIKNKPFGETQITLVSEDAMAMQALNGFYAGYPTVANDIEDGNYTVIINGTAYNNVNTQNINDVLFLGSFVLLMAAMYGKSREEVATMIGMEDTGEVFFFGKLEDQYIFLTDIKGETCQLIISGSTVKKIDNKYIDFPEDDTGAGKIVTDLEFTINGEIVQAAIGAEIFNDYENNIATGGTSHAEGSRTIASGDCAHAEGLATTASGMVSHAEGNNTIASEAYSHAEGCRTIASEYACHAEGYQTIAASFYQHAQGQYNIEDSSYEYAHIVGNGSSSKRSNAHTLDWNGNAWFSGDVYTNSSSGTNKDEGSKKLATEEFVSNFVANNMYTKAEVDALITSAIQTALANL